MVESAASNSKGDQFAVSLVTPWIKGTMDIDESGYVRIIGVNSK